MGASWQAAPWARSGRAFTARRGWVKSASASCGVCFTTPPYPPLRVQASSSRSEPTPRFSLLASRPHCLHVHADNGARLQVAATGRHVAAQAIVRGLLGQAGPLRTPPVSGNDLDLAAYFLDPNPGMAKHAATHT